MKRTNIFHFQFSNPSSLHHVLCQKKDTQRAPALPVGGLASAHAPPFPRAGSQLTFKSTVAPPGYFPFAWCPHVVTYRKKLDRKLPRLI